jgi:HAD superfamily hydrolase (TIGR01509 family)
VTVSGAFPLPLFEAVIFDMDGLVLDTEPAYSHAWRQAAAAFGVDLPQSFCDGLTGRHAGEVRDELSRFMGSAFDPDRFYPIAERCWRQFIGETGIARMAGLEALLNVLAVRRIDFAMATNSDRRYAVECLRAARADHLFSVLVCRDDVAQGKPAPDLFVEAARRLNVSPNNCLVLEDSPTGLTAARRAGAIPVLVKHEPVPGSTRALAVRVFASLAEVAGLITAHSGAAE